MLPTRTLTFSVLEQNYNKSRCHSFRGARHVEVGLDGKPIFCGEIARACGGILGGTEAFGDVSVEIVKVSRLRAVRSMLKNGASLFMRLIKKVTCFLSLMVFFKESDMKPID